MTKYTQGDLNEVLDQDSGIRRIPLVVLSTLQQVKPEDHSEASTLREACQIVPQSQVHDFLGIWVVNVGIGGCAEVVCEVVAPSASLSCLSKGILGFALPRGENSLRILD